MIRLIIVDDDPFICGSLKTILSAQPDIQVLDIGHDGQQAEQLYRIHQPDILLTDIQMPGSNGLDAAANILANWPSARIVILTTFADDNYIVKALSLGAKGYLIKQDVATIAPALRLIMQGQSVLGNEVIGRMDKLVRQDSADDKPAVSGQLVSNPTSQMAGLTSRELEVTELVAHGLDNRQIAAELYISEGTVRNIISTILQKLALKNRTQLAVLYYREG